MEKPDEKLGDLLEKLLDIVSNGSINRVEAFYHGMKITVYLIRPNLIRIDIVEGEHKSTREGIRGEEA